MHLHVALGVGTLQLYTVGSAEGGWQYVAAGEPFSVSEKYGSLQLNINREVTHRPHSKVRTPFDLRVLSHEQIKSGFHRAIFPFVLTVLLSPVHENNF